MAYKRERNYTLEKERDLSLTIAPAGTPIPDHYCRECAHYAVTGHCTRGRLTEVGPLWAACAQFTKKDNVTNVVTNVVTNTMEKKTPTTKVCKKCGRELPAEAFNRHAKSRDGLQPYCRECQRETAKAGAAKDGTVSISTKKDEPVAANPSVTEIPDHDLVQELRRRGYDVKCSKTIEL